MFIRQSVRSDYCLVYATAMMMSRLGFVTDRRTALRLFGAGRRGTSYTGTPHYQVADVLRKRGVAHAAVWHYLSPSITFDGAKTAIRAAIGASDKPTLIAFGAIHRRLHLRCSHAAVVLKADGSEIHVLDSLGRSPLDLKGNVVFRAIADEGIGVEGTIYDFDPTRILGVLHWESQRDRCAYERRSKSMSTWKVNMRTKSGTIRRLQAWVNSRLVIDSFATQVSATINQALYPPPLTVRFRAEGTVGSEVEIQVSESGRSTHDSTSMTFVVRIDPRGMAELETELDSGGFGRALAAR